MDNTNDPVGVLRSALEQISYVADMGTPNGRMLFDIAKTALAAIQHSEQRETVPAGEAYQTMLKYAVARDSLIEISEWARHALNDDRVKEPVARTQFNRIINNCCATIAKANAIPAPVAAPVPEAKADPHYWQKHAVFPVNILGGPMREYAPGKWENAVWPSDAAPAVKHEASELPVDDERCSNCGLHCKVNACIYEPSPPIAVQGSEGDDASVLRYAQELAAAIWQKHYSKEAPQWKVLPDLYGALSQIDNMTTGMSRSPVAAAPSAIDAANYLDDKAEEYLNEHTSFDTDTGGAIFHYGEAGREYHNTLSELADEVRALSAAAPSADAKGDGHAVYKAAIAVVAAFSDEGASKSAEAVSIERLADAIRDHEGLE